MGDVLWKENWELARKHLEAWWKCQGPALCVPDRVENVETLASLAGDGASGRSSAAGSLTSAPLSCSRAPVVLLPRRCGGAAKLETR
jgi:hypothetical protein